MLKRYSQFLESLMLLADLLAISASWIAAYYLRFHWGPVPVYRGIPGIRPYLVLLALIVIIWGVAFKAFGLYRPRRISSRLAEVRDIAQACSLAVLILVALTFFLKQFEFSRLVILYFWVFSILSVSFVRGSFREILRVMRRRGYNLRHVLIVGGSFIGLGLIILATIKSLDVLFGRETSGTVTFIAILIGLAILVLVAAGWSYRPRAEELPADSWRH